MKKELCINQIYDDFTSKVTLTDIEKQVLELYINNESITKISNVALQSTSTVSRIIHDIKEKYNKYRQLEIAKLDIFMKK